MDAFLVRQIAEYAEERRRVGHWNAAVAMGRSREEITELLGDDPGARGHRFFKGIDEAKDRVGWIWIGPPPEIFHLKGAMWLYQITVAEGARGRGFGRGMLVTLHRLLAGEGVEAL